MELETTVFERLANPPKQPYVTTEVLNALTPQQRRAIAEIRRQPFDEEAMKETYASTEYRW